MATKNDITGDEIKSRGNSKDYEDNFDRIFRKNKVVEPVEYSEDWQPEKRDRAIAQNGNIGYDLDEIYSNVEKDYESRD
jgi:hypothetical protein